MPLSHLPPTCLPGSPPWPTAWTAACRDASQRVVGVLVAKGRRTVPAWFKAAGIADDFRQADRTVPAAGRHADGRASRLVRLVRPLAPGACLTVALDDTP